MLDVTPSHLVAIGYANIALFSISTLTVLLRVYVRAALTKTFGADDWLLLAAQIIVIIGVPPFMYLEKHLKDYEPGSKELFYNLSMPFWLAAATYVVASALFKISLALFFLKLAQKQWQKRLIICTAALYTIIVTLYFGLSMFQCGIPIPRDMLGREDCGVKWAAIELMSYILASASAASDWIFAITPIFLVLKARRMKRSSRISVCLLVLLAIMGSTVSIVRILFVSGLRLGPNFLLTQSMPSQLCFTETAIGIMAVSLATLKPLYQLCRDKIWPPDDDFIPRRPHPDTLELGPSFFQTADPSFSATALRGLGVLPDAEKLTFKSFMSRKTKQDAFDSDQKPLTVSVTEVLEKQRTNSSKTLSVEARSALT